MYLGQSYGQLVLQVSLSMFTPRNGLAPWVRSVQRARVLPDSGLVL